MALPVNYTSAAEAFQRLLQIMDDLREKCPWDRKQTLESLRHLSIEEVYELSEAIVENDLEDLKGEAGDLLLHIVFYAKIASEQEAFTITELIHNLCDKLVRRHPHVYGEQSIGDAQGVIQNWEKIKQQEKADKGETRKSVLSGVPKTMPALLKAYRMQEKAAAVGFDWQDPEPVLDKVQEELTEFRQELDAAAPDRQKMEDEFGDLLFSLINYARFAGINPEDALERTNRKFRYRINAIEAEAGKQNRTLSEMSLEEMEAIWQAAKSTSTSS